MHPARGNRASLLTSTALIGMLSMAALRSLSAARVELANLVARKGGS